MGVHPIEDVAASVAELKKAGKTIKLSVKVPDAHPNESWQGKEANIELTINQVRKRVLPTIDDAYATEMGYESLAELREGEGLLGVFHLV